MDAKTSNMSVIIFRVLRFTTKHIKIKEVFDYESSKKEQLARCPGCAGGKDKNFREFGYIDRYGYQVSTSWCNQCGLIFINPRMTLEAYNDFYQSGTYRNIIRIYSTKKPGKKKAHPHEDFIPKRLKPISDVFPEYFGNKKLTILDVGGTREIFEYLRKKINITRYLCINPSAKEISLQENTDFRFYHGTIEDFDSTGEKYDLICLFGTLNHLMEPKIVFDKIGALLKEDGIFAFDHVNRVCKMERAVHPLRQIQIDHPICLDTPTVNLLLNQAGMEVVQVYSPEDCVDFILAGKAADEKAVGTAPAMFDKIELLSRRMRSVPPKFLLKSVLRKFRVQKTFKIH
jgi:SAM-dependent methyltransferase